MDPKYQTFEMFRDVAKEFAPTMHDYLYVYDIPNDTYYITEDALERFHLPGNVFHNVVEAHKIFTYPDDIDMLSEDLNQLLNGEKEEHNLRYRWLGKDGSPIWINCKGRILYSEDGQAHLLIGCINEIGKKQKADNVSGLLGEDSFREYFLQHSKKASGYILRIGIDDFKSINERLGTEYGDMVLKDVADCIQRCLVPGQKAYRIVSDEFIVLELTDSRVEDMKKLYHDIRSEVDKVVEMHQYESIYTISAGLIYYENMAKADYSESLKLSEYALNEAKNRGKNQMYIFDEKDYAAFLRKRDIRLGLRKAVSCNFVGFDLYFQPIVSKEQKQLYAEALLRFQMPNGEWISPVDFIPILEETGLIIPVGKWIMKQAMSMCAECQRTCPDFKVSINLSYVQLLKSPVFEEIVETMEETHVKPGSVIVELTESGQLENSVAIQNVWRKLKNHGVNIAVDDFGTGYSNLQNIGNLNPNIVKIDRSFTLKALQNDYEHELLIHIINMIHSIGLKLVVEGVETREELQVIHEMGPDFVQGYYYSKPCPREEFISKFILRQT